MPPSVGGTLSLNTGMMQDNSSISTNAEAWVFNTLTGLEALNCWNACKHRLLCVAFESVTEYAFLLRAILSAAAALRDRLLVCSSAAVSDFYIPYRLQSREKLRPKHLGTASTDTKDLVSLKSIHHQSCQSSTNTPSSVKCREQVEGGGLSLSLFPVPKFLFLIRDMAPCCFLVSFKLETTDDAVEKGALMAIHSRCVDCVVGNTLSERNHKVVLFTRTETKHICVDKTSHKSLKVCFVSCFRCLPSQLSNAAYFSN